MSSVREHISSCVESHIHTQIKRSSQAVSLEAPSEHKTQFVTGEEVESLKQDSCSFPTPTAYERSQHNRSPFSQSEQRPAERALATHVEVTQGKYTDETGHCFAVIPRAFRVGSLCWCLGRGPEEVSGSRERPETSFSLEP